MQRPILNHCPPTVLIPALDANKIEVTERQRKLRFSAPNLCQGTTHRGHPIFHNHFFAERMVDQDMAIFFLPYSRFAERLRERTERLVVGRTPIKLVGLPTKTKKNIGKGRPHGSLHLSSPLGFQSHILTHFNSKKKTAREKTRAVI